MVDNPDGVHSVAQSAYDAGFRGNDLMNIIAVSLAESGGLLSDLSAQPGSGGVGKAGEVGPWQIHPVHFGTIAPAKANTYADSAAYAHTLVYNTPQGFTHWTQYNNGAYKQFQGAAGEAMRSLPRDAAQPVKGSASAGYSLEPVADEVQPKGSVVPGMGGAEPSFGGGAAPPWNGPFPKATSTPLSLGDWWKIPFGKAAVTVAAVMLIVMGTGIYAFAPAIQHGAKTAAKGLVA